MSDEIIVVIGGVEIVTTLSTGPANVFGGSQTEADQLLAMSQASLSQSGQALSQVGDKLPKSGVGSEAGFLNAVGAADQALETATIPISTDYNPSAPAYVQTRALSPSDMTGIYNPTPGAYNSAAIQAAVNESSQGIAKSGIVVLSRQEAISTPITQVTGTRITSLGSVDMLSSATATWDGSKGSLVAANGLTQGIIHADYSSVDGFSLLKQSVMSNPVNAAAYITNVSSWLGDGLTCDSKVGVKVSDMSVIGWERCGVFLGADRLRITDFRGDGKNGLELMNAYDSVYLNRIDQYPFWAQSWIRANGNPRQCLLRPGTAFYVHKADPMQPLLAADGMEWDGFKAYGYKRGARFADINATHVKSFFIDNVIEWQDQPNPYDVGNPWQSIGVSTEGDCQNSTIAIGHSDSQFYGFAALHAAGSVGVAFDNVTCGSVAAAGTQFLIGANRGLLTNYRYAGTGLDAVAVLDGMVGWRIDNAMGPAGATNILRFANPADAPKLSRGYWMHAGVEQHSFVMAYTAAATPGAGTGNVVWTTETVDNLGEYNPANGVFTAKYAGKLKVYGQLSFTPAAATLQVNALTLQQNGNPFKVGRTPTAATIKATVSVEAEVRVNAGDTLNFTYEFGGTGVTLDAGESILQIVGVID